MILRNPMQFASWIIQHWSIPLTLLLPRALAIIIRLWWTERLLRKLGRSDVQQIEEWSTLLSVLCYTKQQKTLYSFPPPTASSRQPLFHKRHKGGEAGTTLLKTRAQTNCSTAEEHNKVSTFVSPLDCRRLVAFFRSVDSPLLKDCRRFVRT